MTITEQHLKDLKKVHKKLSDVYAEIDSSMDTCPSCGRDSWADLKEGRLGNEVGTMLRKTQKCISVVKGVLKETELDSDFEDAITTLKRAAHENP